MLEAWATGLIHRSCPKVCRDGGAAVWLPRDPRSLARYGSLRPAQGSRIRGRQHSNSKIALEPELTRRQVVSSGESRLSSTASPTCTSTCTRPSAAQQLFAFHGVRKRLDARFISIILEPWTGRTPWRLWALSHRRRASRSFVCSFKLAATGWRPGRSAYNSSCRRPHCPSISINSGTRGSLVTGAKAVR